MDEIEVPLEKVQEDIQHAAHHAADHSQMINWAAMLSALLAVFAAISALFAGRYANEAMMAQIRSSDHWSYYQAKGIKASLTEFRNQTENSEKLTAKIAEYHQQQEATKEKAEEAQKDAEGDLLRHEHLAASVTLFQIAIALTAISVLTRKRRFLTVSATLGVAGVGCMIWSFL